MNLLGKTWILMAFCWLLAGCTTVGRWMEESNIRPYSGDLYGPVLVLHLSEVEVGPDNRYHDWQTLSVINPLKREISVRLDCQIFIFDFRVPARSEKFLLSEGDPANPHHRGCKMASWSVTD